jgi:hypothetical protein
MKYISFVCSFFLYRGGNFVIFQHFTSFKPRPWRLSVNRALHGLCCSNTMPNKEAPMRSEWYCYCLCLVYTWRWHSVEMREIISNYAQPNNLCMHRWHKNDNWRFTFCYDMQGRA